MKVTRSPLVDGSNPFLATQINKHKLGKAQTMPDLAEFMTTQEAAQALGFHLASIQRMIKAGKLEGQRMGGKIWLVSRKSVEEYKKQSEGMSKRDPRRGQD